MGGVDREVKEPGLDGGESSEGQESRVKSAGGRKAERIEKKTDKIRQKRTNLTSGMDRTGQDKKGKKRKSEKVNQELEKREQSMVRQHGRSTGKGGGVGKRSGDDVMDDRQTRWDGESGWESGAGVGAGVGAMNGTDWEMVVRVCGCAMRQTHTGTARSKHRNKLSNEKDRIRKKKTNPKLRK